MFIDLNNATQLMDIKAFVFYDQWRVKIFGNVLCDDWD